MTAARRNCCDGPAPWSGSAPSGRSTISPPKTAPPRSSRARTIGVRNANPRPGTLSGSRWRRDRLSSSPATPSTEAAPTAPRLALTVQYCMPWLRQIENMVLAVQPDAARGYSKRIQQMLGYDVVNPGFMGYVDGMHPARLLEDGYVGRKDRGLEMTVPERPRQETRPMPRWRGSRHRTHRLSDCPFSPLNGLSSLGSL